MLFDFAEIAARDRYKLLASTVMPRPIAWVVTLAECGALNAAPYSFFNVFSGEPPIVCVGIQSRAGVAKDTAANIRAGGEFVINLVSFDLVGRMNVTAIEFEAGIDELREAGLWTAPSVHVAPPRIAESPVALECSSERVIDLGNGCAIVVGRVLAMHIRDAAVIDAAKCYIDGALLDLVGRMHGRGWYVRTSDLFDLPRIDVAEWQAVVSE